MSVAKRDHGSWFHEPIPDKIDWLVDGLITIDGWALFSGKPKAGKSTAIRNLAVSIVKGRKFLNRSIDVQQGRVFYLHLDRKDPDELVRKELKDLGITEADSQRLSFNTHANLPDEIVERVPWLVDQVMHFRPHLLIVDMLWQFVQPAGSSVNDYMKTLQAINDLQDVFRKSKYKGAFLGSFHSRKAQSEADAFDDVLGSTSQMGSFATACSFKLYRRPGGSIYTIQSSQTYRDKIYGELAETALLKDQSGIISLGQLFADMVQEAKAKTKENDLTLVLSYISKNPGCTMELLMNDLAMSKKTVLSLLKTSRDLFRTTGEGVKGDPTLYYPMLTEEDYKVAEHRKAAILATSRETEHAK